MTYACQIVHQLPRPILAVRTRTPVDNLPVVLDVAYNAIEEHLAALGEEPAGPPFVGYFNMDMADLDLQIGFPVARPLPGGGDVQPDILPECHLATCLHTGPYPQMAAAYQALTEFLEQAHRTPSGVVYETYLNNPVDTPAEQLCTRIDFILK